MGEFKKETNISWANKTWNVLAGCAKVSPACKNCYAMPCMLVEKMKKKVLKNIMD